MNEREKWAARVKEFLASGKSQRVWSRENGVNRSTLRYWIERLDELSEGDEVIFAEVKIGGEGIC